VLKAVEKNTQDRYATAKEMADDLRRFLEDKPIQARRPSWRQVATKWARRHRVVVWAAAVTVVLTLAVLGGSVGWVLRDRAARQAEAELPVTAAIDEAERLLGQHKVRAALSAAERADGLLVQFGGHTRLSPQVRQLGKDLRMRVTLEEIRLTQAAVKDNHFDLAGADRLFASAFRDYGIDVDALPPAEAAARVRASRITDDLVAALDAWAMARKQSEKGGKGSWHGQFTVARAVDPHALRGRLQDLLEGRGEGVLAELSQLQKEKAPSAATLCLVSHIVLEGNPGDLSQVVPLLRRAQQRHPDDFWVNHNLAYALYAMKPPQSVEASGFYRAAVAISPNSPGVRVNLGNALRDKKQLDEAIAQYQAAIQIDRKFAAAYNGLGYALDNNGQPDAAIPAFKTAIELDSKFSWPHNGLGITLGRKKQLEEAVKEFRKAIELDSKFAMAYDNLGRTLQLQGRLNEAFREYRQAIALKFPYAYHNLGKALRDSGKLEEAINAYQEAIQLDKNDPEPHINLGVLFGDDQRDYDRAIAEFLKAIFLKKDHAAAHYNLGVVFRRKGQLEAAVEQYRIAVGYNHPQARSALLRTEPLARLDKLLTAVLADQEQPKDAAERIAFARHCKWIRKLNAAAAVDFVVAFVEQPDLAAELQPALRYEAACAAALAAALAAAGQGIDAKDLDEREKTRMRQQALEWLRADLTAWQAVLDKGTNQARVDTAKRMRYWQQDTDFAGVRGEAALTRLPEAERPEWQKLWADVAATLARAENKTPQQEKSGTKHHSGP
jgi:tetratricopeptide (TPR) repeat protein